MRGICKGDPELLGVEMTTNCFGCVLAVVLGLGGVGGVRPELSSVEIEDADSAPRLASGATVGSCSWESAFGPELGRDTVLLRSEGNISVVQRRLDRLPRLLPPLSLLHALLRSQQR